MIPKTEIPRSRSANTFLRTMELSSTAISFNSLKVPIKEKNVQEGTGDCFFIVTKLMHLFVF